ncbi:MULTISPECIES: type IV-A pilus assembly ATPase PilB [Candidatus Ichthyocystis]|uniref:Type II secretion system protein E n=1 Tax=Candidatus Ichthyocystis hellenicum TaxID=1561003 RepID=A0A0S4M0Y6_9BURK|nr:MULTISPECIES: type IV-A pilus assembly ATPase PilB [Ichthyocystis]CUT17447.1 Type II secretion system protein E [Candidatus Ichthyocystis hellenicum]
MDGLSGLAKSFIKNGIIEQSEAVAATKKANENGNSFIEQVLSSNAVSSPRVALFLSNLLGYPLFDIGSFDKSGSEEVFSLQCFQDQRKCYPLMVRDKKLLLAVYDPTDHQFIKDISFQTTYRVYVVVVEYKKLQVFFDNVARSSGPVVSNEEEIAMLSQVSSESSSVESGDISSASVEVDEAPIVRFIQKVITNAISQGVSDIHFEPYEQFYRVRFRIDGVLKEVATPPFAVKESISSRIKVVSRLDISEKRLPQDGRSKIRLSDSKEVDIRVSVLPTLHGEKIVIRILDSSSAMMGIEALGYEPEQKDLLLNAVQRPYGMVLVTGPTGSGKTVSLYTCLNILNKEDVNISTAEDPAEINLKGINQVNVNSKIGLTFSSALKAFLRQDPDIIMVGEIRDIDTAEVAIKAAQTGHLVLSTLHTNDAPSTLTRLINIGVPAYNIVATVHMITAQRLVRRLCKCRKQVEIPNDVLLTAGFFESEISSLDLYAPNGCDQCDGSGYKGRTGVYQVMPISSAIESIILKGGGSSEIAAQARADGVNDLRRSGLIKVARGETSLEEILSSTNI